MEAVRPSETSVNFYPTSRPHIPEDITLRTVSVSHVSGRDSVLLAAHVWQHAYRAINAPTLSQMVRSCCPLWLAEGTRRSERRPTWGWRISAHRSRNVVRWLGSVAYVASITKLYRTLAGESLGKKYLSVTWRQCLIIFLHTIYLMMLSKLSLY
jgi:hypothetical protein